MLIVPESFLGDEYNRPKEFLARLGVKIGRTERPKPGVAGAMVQGYDQSFSQDVTLTVGGRIRQLLTVSAPAEVVERHADGSAALVRTAMGRGAVYYSGTSPEERSYAKLLEKLFEEARVRRPVRVRAVEPKEAWKIESRYAELRGRKLLYVVNFESAPVRVKIDAPAGFFRSVKDLRALGEGRQAELRIAPRHTAIYELF